MIRRQCSTYLQDSGISFMALLMVTYHVYRAQPVRHKRQGGQYPIHTESFVLVAYLLLSKKTIYSYQVQHSESLCLMAITLHNTLQIIHTRDKNK